MLCITVTDCAKRRTSSYLGPKPFREVHLPLRIEPGTCIIARSVAQLKIFIFSYIKNERHTLSDETHDLPVQIIQALNREGVELTFNQSYRFEITTNPLGKHFINS
jgi:hypothetical protein